MSEEKTQKTIKPQTKLKKRLALWLLSLFAIFAICGTAIYLAAPSWIKSFVEEKASIALHRQVKIQNFHLNPYTLALNVQGLSVADNAGSTLLAFDSLRVNADIASLLKGSVVINSLELDKPQIKVQRTAPDRFDISDLIDEWAKPSDTPPTLFSVNNIQISQGAITFVDQVEEKTHQVADLSLKVPFVSNLPHQTEIYVEPHLSAKINGAPVVFTGKTKPFTAQHESSIKVDLDALNLTEYLTYLPDDLPVKIKSGELSTDLAVVFKAQADKPSTFKLSGKAYLSKLALSEPRGADLLALDKLAVTLDELDLVNHKANLEEVIFDGAVTYVQRNTKGEINLSNLAGHNKSEHRPNKDTVSPPMERSPTTPSKSWQITLNKLAFNNVLTKFEDQTLRPSVNQQLLLESLELHDVHWPLQGKQHFVATGKLNQSGELKLSGDVALNPLVAELDLESKALPLVPIQAYLNEFLIISLTGGQLSNHGKLKLKEDKQGMAVSYLGDLTIGNLRTVDKFNNTDFLNWKSLHIGNIDFKNQPMSVNIGEIALSDFYSRLIVDESGKVNLTHIVKKDDKAEAAKTTPEPEKKPMPLRIARVTLQGGTVNFSDRYIKPNYSAYLSKVNGRVTGLSSAADTVADLDVKAVYDTAPVNIAAKLNPFAAKAYLDLIAEVNGVELTSMSTYAAKYAGYAIDKGKLSLAVKYKLENNQLNAENRLFLDQLTFGEKVDSPTATKLPVQLAVSLLKNNKGEIDINLPISGSLDDPEFSVGGIIVKVIINLFVKAVTSPFALLGSMFGSGGEELSNVQFVAGKDTLDTNSQKRLENLAKALSERAALKLEITGRADPETDKEGLKRVAMERAMKVQKVEGQVKARRDSAALDEMEIAPEEYNKYLTLAYKAAKFPKPRNMVGLQKDLPPEEMEKLLLTNTVVDEDSLRELANRRALSVQKWLLEQGKVPQERVFLLAPKVGAGEKGGAAMRADFSLR